MDQKKKGEKSRGGLAGMVNRPEWGALLQVRPFSLSSSLCFPAVIAEAPMYWIPKTLGTTPVPEDQRSKLLGERGVCFPHQYVLERMATGGCLYWLHFAAIPFGPQSHTANGIA